MEIGIIGYIINPMSGARAPIELALSLSKKSKITFFAYDKYLHKESLIKLEDQGIKVVIIKKHRGKLQTIKDLVSFYSNLSHSNIDIFLAHSTLIPLLAAKFTRKPIISTYYGTQFNPFTKYSSSKYLFFIVNIFANIIIYLKSLIMIWLSSKLVSISVYCSNEAKLLYLRSSEVIYLGNISSHLNIKRKVSKNKIELLTISRIVPYKGFERIIKIVKNLNLPNVKLTIIGSSPQKKYLSYLKNILNKDMNIIINAEDKIIRNKLATSHIYLSADKNLFFGMPILESASVGIPSISFDYKAARELIIDGQTGYVVKNDQEFLYYLNQLINSSAKRKQMGIAAKERASGMFSWDETATKYLQIIKRVKKHE